jgi:cytochrome c biogenesis protein CcmG, thiol:disulfide interchange protein DsbE
MERRGHRNVRAEMKISRAFSLLFALICAAGIEASELGSAAPALTAANASGAKISVSEPAAKLTYVDFWASWCGPCKQSFPWMNAMHQKYSKDGLRIVAVNVDKRREDAEKFLKQASAQFEIGFDPEGKTALAYQVKAMPTSMLIDDKGKIVMIHRGFRAEDSEELERKLQQHLGIKK